jgi:hypothetical protein
MRVLTGKRECSCCVHITGKSIRIVVVPLLKDGRPRWQFRRLSLRCQLAHRLVCPGRQVFSRLRAPVRSTAATEVTSPLPGGNETCGRIDC